MSEVEARKPRTPFKFEDAVGAVFKAGEGRAFTLRLWFWTSAWLSLIFIVTLPFYFIPFIELMMNFQAVSNAPSEDISGEEFLALMAPMGKAMPAFLIYMGLNWLAIASAETAFYRKYFFNQESGRQPLQLGREEMRTILAQLGVYGTFIIATMAYFMLFIIVVGIFSAISPILGGLVAIPGLVGFLAIMVIIPVRLAPAAALSHYRGETVVLPAGKVTKFRFWWLLLAYALVFIASSFGVSIFQTIGTLIGTGDPNVAMLMSGASSGDITVDIEGLQARFSNPVFMTLAIFGMIITSAAVAAAVLWRSSVNAYAVQWWDDDSHKTTFD